MQTTDPRRTPRPDSDAHTPKPDAADRPRPARRRAPQRRGPSQSTLVFAAVLVVIVLVAVLVLVLVSRHDRAPKNDPAAQATPTAQVTEQDTVLAEAKHLAAQYDYDKAIAAVTGFAGWENVPELQQAKADFEAQKAQAVRYADPTTIPHIFFHTLIADTARAFDGDPEQGGYNQFMATIKEFNAVLQSLYERGFVLVDIHDVAGPQQQADGSTKYVAGDIYLPAGKKPIVLSQDDVCYYEYMTDSDSDGKPDKGGDGFASRLLVKDGKLTCEYVDADGQTLYGSYDLVPLLDDFLDQHPDFSYRGARATIAVTGYQGAFGYRISNDYKEKLGDEAFAQACTDARAVADALRAEGYTIASHSYGHLTYGDIRPSVWPATRRSGTIRLRPSSARPTCCSTPSAATLPAWRPTRAQSLTRSTAWASAISATWTRPSTGCRSTTGMSVRAGATSTATGCTTSRICSTTCSIPRPSGTMPARRPCRRSDRQRRKFQPKHDKIP